MWKYGQPIPRISQMTGGTTPSYLHSFLAWRRQLSSDESVSAFWDKLIPHVPSPNYWEWKKLDIIRAFNTMNAKRAIGWDVCPQCRGKESFMAQTADGTTSEMHCLCSLDWKILINFKKSLFTQSRFLPESTRNFDLNGAGNAHNPTLTMAKKKAVAFIHNPARWLILSGQKGVGKTMLLRAIATAFGPGMSIYITAADFVNRVMEITTHRNTEDSLLEYIEILQHIPVLLIDDLNREHLRVIDDNGKMPYVMAKLLNVIDYRYGNRLELPTAITTNENVEQFRSDAWGILGSRLTDNANDIVPMAGMDYRASEKRLKEARQ